MRTLLMLGALLLLPAVSSAEKAPPAGRFDPRVRTVAYNPQDIVRVTTYYGVSTPIRFADDERIEPESLDAGDRTAWSIKASARKNILFVRPIKRMAATNLTVVTNKRVYLFLLDVLWVPARKKAKAKGAGDSAAPEAAPEPAYSVAAMRSKALTYSLTFTYPEDGRKSNAAKAADTLRARAADGRKNATGGDYWVAGDEAVAPIDARDDGRFIYLTFARNSSLPQIEGVDAKGKPFAMNLTVDGRTVIIDRMVRQLKLTAGDATACVVNRAFTANGGADTASGTIAPDVVRVIKGEDK
jgi:type IV secretion system protein VirB9